MPGDSWRARIAAMTERADRHADAGKALLSEERQLRATATASAVFPLAVAPMMTGKRSRIVLQ